MHPLQLFNSYSRRDVHAIFSPDTTFVPQAGTWGLHGIVDVPDHPGDYIFMVTFGQSQGAHQFDEFITEDGVLSWQSQPRQGFQDRRIQDFIRHREEVNNIHLFLRSGRNRDYTYFGRLKYLDHDPDRERPVYFQWQILEWPAPYEVLESLGPKLISAKPVQENVRSVSSVIEHSLTKAEVPDRRRPARLKDGPGGTISARRPDYLANHAANQELGLLGELLVLRTERTKLIAAGRPDLAERVRHVSVLENDTAGFDILSYEDDGTKLFIEVKTTRGKADADFFISASELAFAKANSAQYKLYRLFDYLDESASAQFYVLSGAPDGHEQLRLAATNFKVSIRREGE